jgi:NADP-dependent 3-hydroxy acid dehydrogenase YdfG
MAAKRTALVTGASYGVGAASALALAREGFDVAVTATKLDNLAATMKALGVAGARALPLVLDLREQASIEQATADAMTTFGGLDVLVNNAGANVRRLAVDVTTQD